MRSCNRGVELTAARLGRRALLIAVAALLVWFAGHVDWRATGAVLRGASPTLVALAVVAEFASVAAKALRWWLFLRPLGSARPGLPMRATFAGAGFNNLLVGNSGDAARVLLVARALNASKARVLATLALDRAWEGVGYGALLLCTALVTTLPPALARVRLAGFAVMAGLLVLLGALSVAPPVAPSPAQHGGAAHGAPAAPLAGVSRLVAFLRRFVVSLRDLSTVPRSATALVLTLVVWATQVATYALGAAAAHASLGVAGNLVTVLTVNLGFVVRTTPGGVGVFQALYALGARSFGVPGPVAVAAAILIQAVQILPITAVGVLCAPELLRGRVRDDAA